MWSPVLQALGAWLFIGCLLFFGTRRAGMADQGIALIVQGCFTIVCAAYVLGSLIHGGKP